MTMITMRMRTFGLVTKDRNVEFSKGFKVGEYLRLDQVSLLVSFLVSLLVSPAHRSCPSSCCSAGRKSQCRSWTWQVHHCYLLGRTLVFVWQRLCQKTVANTKDGRCCSTNCTPRRKLGNQKYGFDPIRAEHTNATNKWCKLTCL